MDVLPKICWQGKQSDGQPKHIQCKRRQSGRQPVRNIFKRETTGGESLVLYLYFYTPILRQAVLCDWVWRAGVHTGFQTITLVLYIGSLPNLATWFPCGRGRTLFILGSLGQRSRSPLLWIEFLTTGSFPHDNFSSVYWIFTKLGHMIPQWKGKNPIYFGVITIIPFDNLYRRTYFVMHTFFVWLENGYRDWNFSK